MLNRQGEPGHVLGMDDRTPLTDAWHGMGCVYRRGRDGHVRRVSPLIETIIGRCIEPPGERAMTYVILPRTVTAWGGDRLVAVTQTIKLHYSVPLGSTRTAWVDFSLDALAYLDHDVTATVAWLHHHELWMGRRVRGCRTAG